MNILVTSGISDLELKSPYEQVLIPNDPGPFAPAEEIFRY